MNIVYIIGNGFDVSLRMKTRYADFYDDYCQSKEEDTNEDVVKLKKTIEAGKEDWKDLELQLGKYSKQVSSSEKMQQICLALDDALREYLIKEQEKISSEDFDRDLTIEHFAHPERFLLPDDQLLVYQGYDTSLRNIRLITLNYTDTLEKAINYGKTGTSFNGVDKSGRRWRVLDIMHVHGTLDGTPLVGVDNVSQIANDSFAGDQDLLDIIVKPEANGAIKSGIVRQCSEAIQQADIIVLFGVSIGETDLTWWREIGKRLSTNGATRVILFHFDPKLDIAHHSFLVAHKERIVRDDFLKKSDCKGEEKNYRNRIFVGVNSDFLKGIRKM